MGDCPQNGTVIGIEVKAGQASLEDFKHLKWFAANLVKMPFTGIVFTLATKRSALARDSTPCRSPRSARSGKLLWIRVVVSVPLPVSHLYLRATYCDAERAVYSRSRTRTVPMFGWAGSA